MLNGEDYDTLALLENRSIANYRHLLDGIDLLAIDAVSYTHLDVYKRQVQEQSKKPKRKGFLGIFGKKKEVTPAVSTTCLLYTSRCV